jgi:hypothetical protein
MVVGYDLWIGDIGSVLNPLNIVILVGWKVMHITHFVGWQSPLLDKVILNDLLHTFG